MARVSEVDGVLKSSSYRESLHRWHTGCTCQQKIGHVDVKLTNLEQTSTFKDITRRYCKHWTTCGVPRNKILQQQTNNKHKQPRHTEIIIKWVIATSHCRDTHSWNIFSIKLAVETMTFHFIYQANKPLIYSSCHSPMSSRKLHTLCYTSGCVVLFYNDGHLSRSNNRLLLLIDNVALHLKQEKDHW